MGSPSTIAIDPGVSGGLALFDSTTGNTLAKPMPETETDLRNLLWDFSLGNPADVFLEDVGGYVGGPGQPGSAMFKFGRNFGVIMGIALSLRSRIELVRPQKWQKALGLGTSRGMTKTDWKNKLKAEAQRLYPNVDGITLKTADALLILEYAQRQRKAG